MLKAGAVVADKYRVERVLGRGGMGMVLAATHLSLGTRVALKFLHSDMAKHPKLLERFFREARASAKLKSEHICRVSDVAEIDGTPFIVMELLEGTDLRKVLAREGRLPVERACDYVVQACMGIAEAHGAGIIHRDLKPGNLFLTVRADGSPLVKVLDFGVATAPRDDKNFSLTQTTTVLGSPGYMSPEQMRSGKGVDERSDIWALGAILFELLSGRQPFVADSITELALKIGMDPTPRLPGDAPELEAIVHRCLEKDTDKRYRNVAELAEALAPYASEETRHSAKKVKSVLTQASVELLPETLRVLGGARSLPAFAEPPTVPEATDAITTIGRATGEATATGTRAKWPWGVGAVAIASGLVLGIYLRRNDAPPRELPAAAAPVAAPVAEPPPPAVEPLAHVPVDAPAAAREETADAGVTVASEPAKPKPERKPPKKKAPDKQRTEEEDPFGALRE